MASCIVGASSDSSTIGQQPQAEVIVSVFKGSSAESTCCNCTGSTAASHCTLSPGAQVKVDTFCKPINHLMFFDRQVVLPFVLSSYAGSRGNGGGAQRLPIPEDFNQGSMQTMHKTSRQP